MHVVDEMSACRDDDGALRQHQAAGRPMRLFNSVRKLMNRITPMAEDTRGRKMSLDVEMDSTMLCFLCCVRSWRETVGARTALVLLFAGIVFCWVHVYMAYERFFGDGNECLQTLVVRGAANHRFLCC
jgi:hypothetical protein